MLATQSTGAHAFWLVLWLQKTLGCRLLICRCLPVCPFIKTHSPTTNKCVFVFFDFRRFLLVVQWALVLLWFPWCVQCFPFVFIVFYGFMILSLLVFGLCLCLRDCGAFGVHWAPLGLLGPPWASLCIGYIIDGEHM